MAILMAKSFAIEEMHERILSYIWGRFRNPKKRRILSWLLKRVDNILQLTFVLILFPLEIFGTLQELHLLPAWPIYPHPRIFIPFSPSSPFQMPDIPEHLSFRSYSRLLVSLVLSPLIIRVVAGRIRPRVMQKVYAYMRAALPKPQNPDKYSVQGAKEGDLDEDHIPGLKNPSSNDGDSQESGSVLEELAKDLQSIGRSWQQFYDRWISRRPSKYDGTSQKWNILASNPPQADLHPLNINPPPSTSTGPTVSPASSPSTESDPQTTPPSISHDTFSGSPSGPSTPRPPVEITTSTASSGTQHMNIQIPARSPTGEPLFNTNFSNSPPTIDDGKSRIVIFQPYHRLTALTAYSADALALHLSTHITDILIMPFEALWVRSVALAFLSSPAAGAGAQAAAGRWRGEVVPLE
ncbi:hypothetical protein ABVK25_012012 [Lepraria finkii]|uniref:Uncharacterized protein n=1 Tax=Lepraria finkii TaxID=1340010 RepID=A0ABR4AJ93_9LECA